MTSLVPLGMLALAAVQDPAREDGWRSDLEFLLAQARLHHAGPSRPAHTPEFERAVRALGARVGSLTNQAIAVEVQRLMALLGDGHSLVYLVPAPRVQLTMLRWISTASLTAFTSSVGLEPARHWSEAGCCGSAASVWIPCSTGWNRMSAATMPWR